MIALANKKNIEYGKKLSRDEVLIMLSDNIQELNHKIRYGKIRDKANARIKNAQMNSLVYLASNYLKGLKDETLDEIKQELLDLKSGNISKNLNNILLIVLIKVLIYLRLKELNQLLKVLMVIK